MGVGQTKPVEAEIFFGRMIRETGFRLFYKNLYNSMRLCRLRIFDVLARKVCKVELELNQAVLKTLTEERSVLKNEDTDGGEIGLEE